MNIRAIPVSGSDKTFFFCPKSFLPSLICTLGLAMSGEEGLHSHCSESSEKCLAASV